MNDRLDMTVKLGNLTRPQAIALHSMFRHWARLGSMGASRMVAFYVDGDGNFQPRPEIAFSEDIYASISEEQQQELWDLAHVSRPKGDTEASSPENLPQFDFDPVAWRFRND